MLRDLKIMIPALFISFAALIFIHALLLSWGINTSFQDALGSILYDLFN
jgi:hypothetical protein